jgi:lysophospholipase
MMLIPNNLKSYHGQKCRQLALISHARVSASCASCATFSFFEPASLKASSPRTQMDLCLPSDESQVLIIYTGGTIGMLVGDHGYVPEPYFLTETLRSQARFHDPHQDSLFSHAGSVEGFRQWSSSGRTSPSNMESMTDPTISHQPTLLVRSSRPMDVPPTLSPTGGRERQSRGATRPHSIKVADDVYESRVPALVTPRSAIAGGVEKRIRYAILEVTQVVSLMETICKFTSVLQWHPLLDSSDIDIEGCVRPPPRCQTSDPVFYFFATQTGFE